jgi:hypothetical protein
MNRPNEALRTLGERVSDRTDLTSMWGQFLSKQRAAQALSELFGTPVSQGTVSAMSKRTSDGLGEFTEVVRWRVVGDRRKDWH